jgi:hypothetical protein
MISSRELAGGVKTYSVPTRGERGGKGRPLTGVAGERRPYVIISKLCGES